MSDEEGKTEERKVETTTYRDADGNEISAEAVAMGALEPTTAGVPRSYVVPDQEDFDGSGYLGVDPEYATYSHDTHKPLLNDEEQYLFLPPSAEEQADAEQERAERQEELYGVPAPDSETDGDNGDERTEEDVAAANAEADKQWADASPAPETRSDAAPETPVSSSTPQRPPL